jgi:hypothetical protein
MSPDPKANPALTKIDQAIAADADALLQGDFETIDAVLEGVFEEQAALVQMNDKSPAANPRAMAARAPSKPSAAPPSTAHVEQPAPEAEPVTETPVDEPQQPSMPVEEIAAASVEAEVETEPDLLQSSPADAALETPSFALVEEAQSAIADMAPPRERAMRHTTDRVDAAPIQELESVRRRSALPVLSMLKRGVIGVLTIVNYPLRFVPQSQRPMVDWIALSLLGWVPVVWVLVLTLGNRNAHVQASAEVHEAGSVLASTPVEDKAMHETAVAEPTKDAPAHH